MAKRLLIVDDALIMRMKIKEIATEAGWDIVGEAASGTDAVEQFRKLRPDLVTMDIVMPHMDGVAALRAVKQQDPGARVVMVSAVDQKEKLLECVRLGAVDFIVKPFDNAVLRNCFESVGRSLALRGDPREKSQGSARRSVTDDTRHHTEENETS